jgi:hypothetical protein
LVGRLLWPAVLTAAAVVAVVVSDAGTDTRAELDYLSAMHEHSSELSIGGESVRLVISRLSRIERTELVTATDAVNASLQTAMGLVEAGPPSPSLIAANALFRQAIQSWSLGISSLTAGILAAADDTNSTVVVDNVANALAELRAGDRLYSDLVEQFALDEVPEPVAPMPPVVMMPADGELLSLAQAYVVASRSINSAIALRPGLTVSQIVTTPLWTVNPSDQAVVPATETLSFSVVVSNLGNVASEPEPMQLTLTGPSDPLVLTDTVPILAPGEQTTVLFAGLTVVPGAIYEVVAELRVVNLDQDFEDNTLTVVFSVNEDEGS